MIQNIKKDGKIGEFHQIGNNSSKKQKWIQKMVKIIIKAVNYI